MHDYLVSLIRTWVPILVGAGVSWLFVRGIEISAEAEAAAIVALTASLQAIYYAIARALEARWTFFGILLGTRNAPNYAAPSSQHPDPG